MRKISFVKFEAFEVCFLGLEEEPFLRSYFIERITFKALEKCETECNMLEIILVQGFSPWKSNITRFPNGLFLKSYLPSKKIYLFRWTSRWDFFQSPPQGPKVLFVIERWEYYRDVCRRGQSVHVSQWETKFIRLVPQKILGNNPITPPLSQHFALTKRLV